MRDSHDPAIESSFNVMGDIFDVKSPNSSIETYSSYQTVKYKLKGVRKNAARYFRKDDFKKDGIVSKLLNRKCSLRRITRKRRN